MTDRHETRVVISRGGSTRYYSRCKTCRWTSDPTYLRSIAEAAGARHSAGTSR